MKLSAAMLEAGVEALEAVLPLARPADGVLRDFFRARRRLGGRDRAFIAESVFGVLRHLSVTRHVAGDTPPRALLLAYLVRFGGISVRELAPLLDAEEMRWLTERKAITLDEL